VSAAARRRVRACLRARAAGQQWVSDRNVVAKSLRGRHHADLAPLCTARGPLHSLRPVCGHQRTPWHRWTPQIPDGRPPRPLPAAPRPLRAGRARAPTCWAPRRRGWTCSAARRTSRCSTQARGGAAALGGRAGGTRAACARFLCASRAPGARRHPRAPANASPSRRRRRRRRRCRRCLVPPCSLQAQQRRRADGDRPRQGAGKGPAKSRGAGSRAGEAEPEGGETAASRARHHAPWRPTPPPDASAPPASPGPRAAVGACAAAGARRRARRARAGQGGTGGTRGSLGSQRCAADVSTPPPPPAWTLPRGRTCSRRRPTCATASRAWSAR
jgi:hypothetical protein